MAIAWVRRSNDLKPHTTIRDIKFLELIARWSMSGERNRLLKAQDTNKAVEPLEGPSRILSEVRITPRFHHRPTFHYPGQTGTTGATDAGTTDAPDFCLGMAGVVSREIYGPLTAKQKEYLEIIQNSGRYLLSLVNEISELGALDESTQSLNLISVDIEMLCQQAINILEEAIPARARNSPVSGTGTKSYLVLDKTRSGNCYIT